MTSKAPIAPAVLVGLLLTNIWVIQADDWPQWRGPNRDGVWKETGIMEAFPAGGLPVSWRAPVGRGWSSPVVCAGRVYVTDVEVAGKSARERVLAFNAGTGKPLWMHPKLVLYICGKPDACVVALDKNPGPRVWRALDDPFKYSSPIDQIRVV